MVPWSLSDQIWIRSSCFCFWKLFVFPCGFSAKMTCAFLAYQKDWRNYQNQTLFFRVRKTTLSSKFLIRLRFQGNRCKSGISIFAWRVTWYYNYSSFQIIWFNSKWYIFRTLVLYCSILFCRISSFFNVLEKYVHIIWTFIYKHKKIEIKEFCVHLIHCQKHNSALYIWWTISHSKIRQKLTIWYLDIISSLFYFIN